MLVLTRRPGQTITIGDPASAEAAIEITIVEVRGEQVKIGIKAPRDVSVDRTEVREQKQQRATHGGGA